MSPTALAVTDLVVAFGLPTAAIAGGIWLRRRPVPSKAAYWGGTVLAAGGALVLAWIGVLILVYKNW